MKTVLVLSIALLTASSYIFSQCPEDGLKIQSLVCENPKDLGVHSIICTSILVKWKGRSNQTYIIKATCIDPVTKRVTKTEALQYSCDNKGNCSATIPVKEGITVNWSVQTICTNEGSTLYSDEVQGPKTTVPVCQKINKGIEQKIYAFPNPSPGYLIVKIQGSITNRTEFKVFDMNGKMVLRKNGDAETIKENSYNLDLQNLASGTYMLRVTQGRDTNQIKFVLIR